jgi:hypothetical protein
MTLIDPHMLFKSDTTIKNAPCPKSVTLAVVLALGLFTFTIFGLFFILFYISFFKDGHQTRAAITAYISALSHHCKQLLAGW